MHNEGQCTSKRVKSRFKVHKLKLYGRNLQYNEGNYILSHDGRLKINE